jgi:FtsP/CotA-like multicopper oxidase with cupredoxin domain
MFMNEQTNPEKKEISRRDLLKFGVAASIAGLMIADTPLIATIAGDGSTHNPPTPGAPMNEGTGMEMGSSHGDYSGTMGEIDLTKFDPSEFLYDFDWGKESTAESGQTVREWNIIALDIDIEIAPGVFFPAWTYNGQVPGPTFRCREGDLLRFHFANGSTHPHTIHFHGFHPPSMDGVEPIIQPGEAFTYEFKARPFGVHPYHCHVMSLKKHIHKGLYGTLIIDPPQGREPAHEMIMVMNAFDTTFDNANEVYAVNTVAFHYARHPIQVKVGELVRVYVTNMTEFDLINSFHLHASMFRLYRTGTNLEQFELTDTVIMGQGERAVLEFTLDDPGKYMFHAHQSEFAELGWMGFFEAVA